MRKRSLQAPMCATVHLSIPPAARSFIGLIRKRMRAIKE